MTDSKLYINVLMQTLSIGILLQSVLLDIKNTRWNRSEPLGCIWLTMYFETCLFFWYAAHKTLCMCFPSCTFRRGDTDTQRANHIHLRLIPIRGHWNVKFSKDTEVDMIISSIVTFPDPRIQAALKSASSFIVPIIQVCLRIVYLCSSAVTNLMHRSWRPRMGLQR